LGLVSYRIYLWHEGVFEIYRDVRGLPVFTGSLPTALVVTVAGSVVAAGLSYLLVERPALSFKDPRRRVFAGWRPVGPPAEGAAPPEAGPAPGTDAGEEGRAVGTGTVRPPAAGDEGTPAGDDGPGDAADGGGRAGRPGGIRRWLRDNPWVVPTVVVGVAVALPLRGVFRAPGPPMEVGFMIVFPERLLKGDVP